MVGERFILQYLTSGFIFLLILQMPSEDLQRPPLYVITGPTASGKSAIAFEMAGKLNTSIISADSLQIYKHLNIGTAKPSVEMRQEVVHHCVDELEVDEEYNAFLFRNRADKVKKENDASGLPTLICGGTGLFIDAFIYGFSCSLPTDKELRSSLHEEARTLGVEALFERLRREDPAYAGRITKGDRQKIIRALEVISLSGKTFSTFQEEQNKKRKLSLPPELRYIVITQERTQLYNRINRRVDEMFQQGLTEEVKALLDAGYNTNLKPLRSIGYKETIACLEGKCSPEEAKEAIKQNSRHLAKRQLTWHRRKEFARYVDVSNISTDKVTEDILSLKNT